MKNKYLLSIASFCFAAFALSSCATKADSDYITLEVVTADFSGKDNQPVVITVKSNNPITAEVEKGSQDWILLSDVTANSFTVNAADNETGYYRNGIITIKAGNASQEFTVYQIMQDNEFNYFRRLFTDSDAISLSGKHIAADYFYQSDDGTLMHKLVYIDTETEEKIEFDPIPDNILKISEVKAVSDTGHIYVSVENGSAALFDIQTMTYSIVAPPAGMTNKPQISQVSVDGTKAVGQVQGTPHVEPVLWENGEPRKLEKPSKSFRNGDPWYGPLLRGISADGSIIYGSSWEGFDGGLLWWKNGELMGYAGGTDVDTGEEIHFVSEHKGIIDVQTQFYTNGLAMQADCYQISSKGTYIGAFYRQEVDKSGIIVNESGKSRPVYHPAFFNTVTNKTRVFRDLPEGMGLTATEDGIGFVTIGVLRPGEGGGITACYVVNIETGEILGTAQEWIKINKGLETPFGGVRFVNDDKSVIYVSTHEGLRAMQWYIGPVLKK